MKLKLFQVDAFAEKVFEGNPAAVCPLDEWLDDALLQAIADENNLSETAFLVAKDDHYELRWFTPEAEVDLCGHATLASAHVVFNYLGYSGTEVRFQTRSGFLTVAKQGEQLVMDFPATQPEEITPPAALLAGLSNAGFKAPSKVYAGFDYIAVYDSEADIRALTPDFAKLSELDLRGVLVTAPGEQVDFISRCFFPKLRVNEDPVTGSAHCQLAPLWSQHFNQTRLTARQLSKRGGSLICDVQGERVQLIGSAQDYLQGELTLP